MLWISRELMRRIRVIAGVSRRPWTPQLHADRNVRFARARYSIRSDSLSAPGLTAVRSGDMRFRRVSQARGTCVLG